LSLRNNLLIEFLREFVDDVPFHLSSLAELLMQGDVSSHAAASRVT